MNIVVENRCCQWNEEEIWKDQRGEQHDARRLKGNQAALDRFQSR